MTDPIVTDGQTPEQTPLPVPESGYRDDELVYVDPDARAVVGHVEWSRNGNPKAKARPQEPAGKDERRRPSGRKYYPWGTYRSMRNVFKLEGKKKREENTQTLEEILPKALKDAFWD